MLSLYFLKSLKLKMANQIVTNQGGSRKEEYYETTLLGFEKREHMWDYIDCFVNVVVSLQMNENAVQIDACEPRTWISMTHTCNYLDNVSPLQCLLSSCASLNFTDLFSSLCVVASLSLFGFSYKCSYFFF